jgi:hypothetical protein
MAATFESAIPEHLRADRTIPARMPEGYAPPFPAWGSQFPKKAADLAMAVFGAQFASEDDAAADDGTVHKRLQGFAAAGDDDDKPIYHEWASVTDAQGFYNLTMIAYWPSRAGYEAWTRTSGFAAWWESTAPAESDNGWFLEVFFPSVDRVETVFSHPGAPEGVAHLEESQIGPIREHIYWGSMRDRLPASQTAELEGTKDAPTATVSGQTTKRVRVHGQKNLAVIRSGQDISTALPDEADLYRTKLGPVLERGMLFLRDQGDEVGCHSCRFMNVVDPDATSDAAPPQRTFGLAYFDDLASLEGWSREHPTHLAIFGEFMQYAQRLQGNISLRLFHEVLVLTPDQQLFEYVGCHPGTGLLRTAAPAITAVSVSRDAHHLRQLAEAQDKSPAVADQATPVADEAPGFIGGLVASVSGKFRDLMRAISPTFMTPTRLKAT